MINKFNFSNAAILFKQKKPLLIRKIEIPENLHEGQVLVKNFYSGVCGSQLGEIEGIKGKDNYLPHLLGHEAVGEVLKVGKKVSRVKKGDHVLLHWMPTKGISSPGPKYILKNKIINAGPIATFSNLSIVSENRLTPVKKNLVNHKELLLLGCTVSTAVGSIKKITNYDKTETVAVAGCGAIGLTIVKVLKYLGTKKIIAIDLDEKKLKIARKFGATYCINSKKKKILDSIVRKFPNKIDKFFECTGNVEVISDAFECLNQMGSEILIGVPQFKKKAKFYTLDINLGKKLVGCKGGNFQPSEDLFKYLRLMEDKKFHIKELITREVKLNDLNDVFSDMKKNKIIGKCIINFNQE